MRDRLDVLRWLGSLCAVLCLCNCGAPSDPTRSEPAATFVHSSGVAGGICMTLNFEDPRIALSMAEQGRFLVHALHGNSGTVDQLRKAIREQGAYGPVSADKTSFRSLPYVDNLINLAVVHRYPELEKQGLPAGELIRVLSPLGSAFLGLGKAGEPEAAAAVKALEGAGLAVSAMTILDETWIKVTKSWPQDIDEWTHNTHGPDGNPVADDKRVGPPSRFQWISDPLWLRGHDTDSSVSGLVTARGRVFYMVDDAPIGLPGQHDLPDNWHLAARDAFNGRLLWKLPIKDWGWRAWKDTWFKTRAGDMPLNLHRRLVAGGDRVYATLGYHAPVSQIDARTGKILSTYDGTENTNEIICHAGRLILSMIRPEGIRIAAIEAETGRERWVSPGAFKGTTTEALRWQTSRGEVEAPLLDPAVNLAVNDEAVCLIDDNDIVCLDFETGAERWRKRVADIRGGLWVGTVILHGGVLIHAGADEMLALSASDGEKLWSIPKRTFQGLWFQWKDVFVIHGLVWTWSHELSEARDEGRRFVWPKYINAYDLRTGALKEQVPTGDVFAAPHHHRCYRNKATVRYILASRRGTEFIDLHGGEHTVNNWVRGTCHLGMMPANGLQYAPPHPCKCYINEKLSGFCALATGATGVAAEAGPELEKGPAYGDPEAGEAGAADWPTYRHDPFRSGSAGQTIADRLTVKWTMRGDTRPSAPVVAGGKVLVSWIDAHRISALDAETGSVLWEQMAGGRVDSPPTYDRGRVLFGSADGSVYCLRAADGALAWRFRAAPQDRLMGAFDQLESVRPVHGSVLVKDDVAYFAAGRSSYLDGGILIFGLDVRTGEVRYRTKLEGPGLNPGEYPNQFTYEPGPGSLPDILQADDKRIYMREAVFDPQLNRLSADVERIQTLGSFLDNTYFRRAYWFYGNPKNRRVMIQAPYNWSLLIVADKLNFFTVRMFDDLRNLDPFNYFVPGQKGYRLSMQGKAATDTTWSRFVPIRIQAMVATPDKLIVAGPPDRMDAKDPLGAFEARQGGLLWIFGKKTGKKVSEVGLDSPPVFDGMAAADEKLYLSTQDNRVLCYESRDAETSFR